MNNDFAKAIENSSRLQATVNLYASESSDTLNKAFQVSQHYNVGLDTVLSSKDDFFRQYDFDTNILPNVVEKSLPSPVQDFIQDPNTVPVIKDNLNDYIGLNNALDAVSGDKIQSQAIQNVLNDNLLGVTRDSNFDISTLDMNKENIMNLPIAYPVETGNKATDKAIAQQALGISKGLPATFESVMSGATSSLLTSIKSANIAVRDLLATQGQNLTQEQQQAFNERFGQDLFSIANPIGADYTSTSYPDVKLPTNVLSAEAKNRLKVLNIQNALNQPRFESQLLQDIYDFGVTNVAQNIPAIGAGLLTRNVNVGLAIGSLQSGLDQYLQVRLRDGGKGEAALAGGLNAATELLTESMPMSNLVNAFSSVFGKSAGKKEFVKYLRDYVLSDLAGEQVATLAQDAIDTAIANPDKTWGEYFSERQDRAYQTAVGSLFTSTLFGGTALGLKVAASTPDAISRAMDRARVLSLPQNQVSAKIAQTEVDAIEAGNVANGLFQTLTEADKIKQQNPVILEQFIKKISETNGINDVYLDAQSLSTAINSNKIDITEISQISPEIGQKIVESIGSGTDVVIPLSDFVKTFAGEPTAQKIIPFVKLDEKQPSLAEVESADVEALQADLQKIIKGAEVQKAFDDSTREIAQSIKDQIDQTGRVPKTLSGDASKLFASTFESIALDENITPRQAYDRYGFDIVNSVIDNGKIVSSKTRNGKIVAGEYIPSTDRPQIALYNSPNMTNILHEFGHAYLDILFKRASGLNPNQKVQDDTKAVLDFFKIENLQAWNALSFDQQIPYHEKFAENYEAYLMEGKEPKPALKRVFLKFSTWLQVFYKNFVSPLDRNKITPEIRRVFDNMVLSQSEIKQAIEEMNLQPLTEQEFLDAGKTNEDYQDYIEEYKLSDANAIATLQQKQMKALALFSKKKDVIVKGLTNQFNKHRNIIKTFVIADLLKTDKDYRLLTFLKTKTIGGNKVDLPNKFNEEYLKRFVKLTYGLNVIPENLKQYVSQKNNTTTIEDLTDYFGYDAPEFLLNTLIENPSFESIIDKKTDEIMVENFGNAFSPEAINQKAIDALHSEATQNIIQKELEIIESLAGKNRTNLQAMKFVVNEAVLSQKISSLKPNVYLRSEQKSAQLFAKSKSTEDRIKFKRQQLFNFLMYQKSLETKDKYIKTAQKIKSIQKAIKDKKIIGENVDAIKLLLEMYDFRKSPKTQFDNSLGTYIDNEIKKGLLPENFKDTIPESVLSQKTKTPYYDLTVQQMDDFIQSLSQLEFAGRVEKQQFDAYKKYNFEQEKEAILSDIKQYNPKSFDDQGNPIEQEDNGYLKKFASEAMSAEEALLALTDNKAKTPWESFFNRLNRATLKYDGLKADFAKTINKAVNLYAGVNVLKSMQMRKMKTEKKAVYFDDNTQKAFTREEAMLIALYNGTQEGRQRLQDLHGFTQGKVAKIIDEVLIDDDIRLIKAMWSATKPHFKMLQDINLKTTGQKIEQSVVVPFETSKYQFAGGYVPLVYEKDLINNIAQAGENNFRTTATNRGSSKTRLESVSKDKKLDLSFGGILFKIDQTMRDIAYRESVLAMNRLLRDKDINSAFIASFGQNKLNALENTIREAVNPSQLPDTTAMAFVKYAQKSTLINFLSGFQTASLNFLNLIPLSKEFGILNIIKSTAKFLNPTNYYRDGLQIRNILIDQAANESDFIFKEFQSFDNRSIDSIQSLGKEAGLTDFLPDFTRIAFYLMSVVTKITGAIAYDAGKASGKSDREIQIAYRQAVGTDRQIDQTGGQQNVTKFMMKAIMPFLSYMQKQFSVLSASFTVAKKQQTKKAWINFIQEYFFRFVLPSVLTTFLQGLGGDESPEVQDYLASTTAYTLAGGGIYGLILSGLTYYALDSGNVYKQQTKFASPLSSFGDSFRQTFKELSGDEEVDVKNLVKSTGLIFKLPSSLAVSSGNFLDKLYNYFDGEESFDGLAFGEQR